MSENKVITVHDLSKIYRIDERSGYKTLCDSINRFCSRCLEKLKNGGRSGPQTANYVWALKGISFDVKKGQKVGIIGRNGSGKTTLLKVLSRITYPTEGYAQVTGKVATLLEVGTGFHPELTGRDNVYLSGAILGMKKAEIMRKFDEIITFAELEKFVDTPVKHYSSGMFVRLAFSVAAHLDSDIVFVDETLAVGDLAFQKKCLGKIDDIAKSGRTVLFVTHQMNQVRRICDCCIWLDSGSIRYFGPTPETVSAYEAMMGSLVRTDERADSGGYYRARFLKWEITQPLGPKPNAIDTTGAVEVDFSLKINTPVRHGRHGIALFNSEGQLVWGAAAESLKLDAGLHTLKYKLSSLPLKPGYYYWLVTIYEENTLLDSWYCFPELLISTLPLASRWDNSAGFLNLPYQFHIASDK